MTDDSLKIRRIAEGATPLEPGPSDVKRQWIEARVRELYGEAAAEEIPEQLVALVMRLGRAH
jgi:hypothetical protein